ncbi:MAG: SGNH/GDSL hydrolase family protein [Candidatus Eremiobacteraeota bacterium]|nr:SGNH/GDSL hydrolase family protein [Candidatus Eremiobacteraeota bacterium]
MPSPPSCPGGKSYVVDLTGLLSGPSAQVTLVDLGISGAVIGPDIQADTAACFGAPGNIITSEVPLINASSTLVTVFTGGNDTNAIVQCSAGNPNPAAFIAAEMAKFGADYATLIQDIKKAAPNAEIVVSNLPNFALIPVGTMQPAPVQAALDQVSVGLDMQVINPSAGSSVNAVVDALCTAQSYNVANFSADGFHPNDAGYAAFAQLYANQVQAAKTPPAPAPQSSCPPYSLAAKTSSLPASVKLWRY